MFDLYEMGALLAEKYGEERWRSSASVKTWVQDEATGSRFLAVADRVNSDVCPSSDSSAALLFDYLFVAVVFKA